MGCLVQYGMEVRNNANDESETAIFKRAQRKQNIRMKDYIAFLVEIANFTDFFRPFKLIPNRIMKRLFSNSVIASDYEIEKAVRDIVQKYHYLHKTMNLSFDDPCFLEKMFKFQSCN